MAIRFRGALNDFSQLEYGYCPPEAVPIKEGDNLENVIMQALRQALPAVNLNGYRDAEGAWHWFGETVETDAQQKAEDALKSYAIVQYDQLFKDRSNR